MLLLQYLNPEITRRDLTQIFEVGAPGKTINKTNDKLN